MKNIWEKLTNFKWREETRKPRLYVLVRKDLNPIYACVQGCHAVSQFCLNRPEQAKEWNNEYLIYLYQYA